MPRIIRNYLISFAIIGLILLAVHLVNRWVAQQMPQEPPAAAEGGDAARGGE